MSFTSNRVFDLQSHGGNVDSWDTPLNANLTNLDTMLGGMLWTTVSSGSVNLASTAYKYGVLRFTGAVTSNITVTLPSKQCYYIIDNFISGQSSPGVDYYLKFSAGGTNSVACPPGKSTHIYVDSVNSIFFANMPEVGAYWDYAGFTTPTWIAACTIKPWLLCDGSTYPQATYPFLATILGYVWGGSGANFAVPTVSRTTAHTGLTFVKT